MWCDSGFKSVVEEQYYISKHTSNSWSDTNIMPDFERNILVGILLEDIQREIDSIKKGTST